MFAPDWKKHSDYPLVTKPDSWDLDPIFMRKIDELMHIWAEAGYEWKWGYELEFQILSTDEAEKRLKEDLGEGVAKAGYLPECMTLQAHLEQARKAEPGDQKFFDALETVREYFSSDPDSAVLMRETNWSHQDVMNHLNDFENDLRGEDAAKAETARKNIFLALIHVLPYARGGLRDIIEPRFGDHGLGLGWNDYQPEVRTRILSDPRETIRNSLRYLDVLSEQAARFGMSLDLTISGAPHIHFSVWRKSDGMNMMEMRDTESTVFCEKMMHGIYHVFADAPFMAQDRDIRQERIVTDIHAGSTRLHSIRQESDNWEMRRPHFHSISHTARYIMMIMMGTAYGALYNNDDSLPAQDIRDDSSFFSTAPRWHPVVRHKFGAHISGLASVVEHSVIDDSGYLIPDANMIENYMLRLKEEVGIGNLKEFVVTSTKNPGLSFDLTHQSAWEVMLRQVRINDDGDMDFSFLPEDSEITEAFRAIEITGRRIVLHSNQMPISCDAQSTDFMMGHFRSSKIGTLFFTPYEYSEIARHYARQARWVMAKRAESDCDRLIRTTQKNPDIPPETIAEAIFDHLYLKPTEDIDIQGKMVELIMGFVETGSRLNRDYLLAISSYLSSMRPYFEDAAQGRIDDLRRREPEGHERLIETFEKAKSRIRKKSISFCEETSLRIVGVLSTIADGTMVRHTGMTSVSAEAILQVPNVTFIKSLTIAMMDECFTNADLSREVEMTYLRMPSILENARCDLGIEKKDQLTRDMFDATCRSVMHHISEIRDWTEKNFGRACVNALPYNPEKRSLG